MTDWTIKNHGLVVNLYQIKKMLGDESDTIDTIEFMMVESYNKDMEYIPQYNRHMFNKNMTFDEYVNAKRHWLASILGLVQYA